MNPATIQARPRVRDRRVRARRTKTSRPTAPPKMPPRDREPSRPPVISTAAPPSHSWVESMPAAGAVPGGRGRGGAGPPRPEKELRSGGALDGDEHGQSQSEPRDPARCQSDAPAGKDV